MKSRIVPMLIFLAGGSAMAADAQLDAARKSYRAAAWPAGTLRDGCMLDALQVRGLGPVAREGAIDGIVTRRYQDARGIPVLTVEMAVAPTVAAAQERLVFWLAYVSAPTVRPDAASRGILVGEAAFVGPSGAAPGRLAWIAFVRGNVAFRVTDLDPMRAPAPDLAAVARSLDALALARPAAAPGALSAPAIRALAAASGSVVEGEAVAITADVADPTGAPVLDWVVGGPGQGYVERNVAGQWHLHATGAGPVDLVLQATGGNGTAAVARTRIEILPAP